MPGLNVEAWRVELRDDPGKAFLLNGVINGFSIVNSDSNVVPAEVANHLSALPGSEHYEMVKQQVLSEISEGNYVTCDKKNGPTKPARRCSQTYGRYKANT